jgi:biopolymer transport protein ExbD
MRRPKRRVGVAIDMTPMVDVAFLLLIFFMTTTSFKPPEEVVIQLPVSHAEYKVPDSDVLILTITKDSQLFSQVGTSDPMAPLDATQVGNLIRTERMRNTRLRVVVKADRDCPYGAMEDMMNALQEARATRFVLMTEGEEKGSTGPTKEFPTDEERAREKGTGDLGALFGDPGAATEVVIAGDPSRQEGAVAEGALRRSREEATWPE